MNKHTPGPWTITGDRDAIEAQCPGAPYKIIIAETIGYKHIREPNARLIAAAPDLLAACEELLATHTPGACGSRTWNAREAASAATRKAKGEC
jgi:hypothetical protein